jgi:hypothetical protein
MEILTEEEIMEIILSLAEELGLINREEFLRSDS